jgi:hypothetical protein
MGRVRNRLDELAQIPLAVNENRWILFCKLVFPRLYEPFVYRITEELFYRFDVLTATDTRFAKRVSSILLAVERDYAFCKKGCITPDCLCVKSPPKPFSEHLIKTCYAEFELIEELLLSGKLSTSEHTLVTNALKGCKIWLEIEIRYRDILCSNRKQDLARFHY